MPGELERRRKARQVLSSAEERLVDTDKRMRAAAGTHRDVPPMEPTPERLAADKMYGITLDVEWTADALAFTRGEGWASCISVWQPLVDYANHHPDGHLVAFDEVVTDDRLREILYRALDTI